ncbi:MAG TPA: FHA domain-containing protein [Roseiflexaceae bacterium]|nr:FHA domain-containing protein [Roseiflexaceae bacterium]
MSYPQIYVGVIPDHLHERRALRTRALDLRVRLRNTRDPSPALVLLNAYAPGCSGIASFVLARPQSLIVANMRAWPQPLGVRSAEPWIDLQTGSLLAESGGRSPFEHIAALRDAVREHLLLGMAENSPEARVVARAIAAVVCAPTLHPESQIQLDVDDHRNRLKVLGLDELAGLASMAGAGVHLSESVLHTILADMLGGRLWHDGNRLLFELAEPRFELVLLDDAGAVRATMTLLEGENVIGRRRTTRPHEYRITITSDDMISSDHALITCHHDDVVTLRDVSKNGTWVTLPGAAEVYLHEDEMTIRPGTRLRLGVTTMTLHPVAGATPA